MLVTMMLVAGAVMAEPTGARFMSEEQMWEQIETGSFKAAFGCKERMLSGAEVVKKLDGHTYQIRQFNGALGSRIALLRTTKTKIDSEGPIDICVKRKL